MNTTTARNILNEAAHLMELTASFQARYGRAYRISISSPADASDLHNQILDIQSIIANLLDPEALNEAHAPYGQWWQRHDVMEASMAQQLISEISYLITSTAHVCSNQSEGKETMHHAVKMTQRAIAGMLHPDCFKVHADPELQRQAG
jgi:hypothetical protein